MALDVSEGARDPPLVVLVFGRHRIPRSFGEALLQSKVAMAVVRLEFPDRGLPRSCRIKQMDPLFPLRDLGVQTLPPREVDWLQDISGFD